MDREQESFFDEKAYNWEEEHYPPEVRKRLESLLDTFPIQRGQKVLDVGTGTGVLLPYLVERVGSEGIIFGFDLSFNMVREASKKNLPQKVYLLQGDVHNLPFKDSYFDLVICFAAFPHFRDPQTALREMARVLEKGSELIIAHLMSREELKRHHGTHRAVERDILPDEDTMKHMFVHAGLTEPTIVDIPGRYISRAKKPF